MRGVTVEFICAGNLITSVFKVGQDHLVVRCFVRALRPVLFGKLFYIVTGTGAVAPLRTMGATTLEPARIESVKHGVAVAGLCTGGIESTMEFAATVRVVWGQGTW